MTRAAAYLKNLSVPESKCPVCGSSVGVYSSPEGTCHYIPADIKKLIKALKYYDDYFTSNCCCNDAARCTFCYVNDKAEAILTEGEK